MNTLSNTPPDGDFVRYLERLPTGDLAVVQVQPSLGTNAPKATAATPSTAAVASKPGSEQAQLAMERLAVHLKWAAVILIATQLLGAFIPGAGFLLLPALVAYWFYALYNRPEDTHIGAALLQRFRDVAVHQQQQQRQQNALLKPPFKQPRS